MSLEDSQFKAAHRSYSNESISLRNSLSLTKVNKNYLKLVKQEKSLEANQSFVKINSKNQQLLNPIILKTQHIRNSSDKAPEKPRSSAHLNDFNESYYQFLSKLDNLSDIELKIAFLIEFLKKAAKISFEFAKVFLKISELVKEYQTYVKNLGPAGVQKKILALEVKNVNFNEKKINETRPKPPLKITKRDDSNKSSVSQDSSYTEKEHFQKISEIKSLCLPKPAVFSEVQKTHSKVPKISLAPSEKVDFHQEFMSRLDEFSDSWREEALKLRNK